MGKFREAGIAIGVALAIYSSYVLHRINQNYPVFWKKSRQEYVEKYNQAFNARIMRPINGMKEEKTSGLEAVLADYGFLCQEANSYPMKNTALIVLSDLQNYDEKTAKLMAELLSPDNLLLLEQMSLPLPTIAVSGVRLGRETLKSYLEKARFEMESISVNQDLWSILPDSLQKKVVHLNDASESKQKLFMGSVRSTLLNTAYISLSKKQELHPLQKWVIFEDMGLCPGYSNRKQIMKSIEEYLAQDSYDALVQAWQKKLVDNAVDISGGLRDSKIPILIYPRSERKCILVVSSHHAKDISKGLQRKRAAYAAFQHESNTYYGIGTSEKGNIELNARYIEEVIVPKYIRLRLEQGTKPYLGPTNGLADRILEFAKLCQ